MSIQSASASKITNLLVTAIAAIVLGYLIAKTFNRWIETRLPTTATQRVEQTDNAENTAKLSTALGGLVAGAHLFGQFTAEAIEKVEKPKATRDSQLNIRLVGVINSSNNNHSMAILSEGSQPEEVYLVGEEIKPNVTLKIVASDHILIENAGIEERIEMPKNDSSTSAGSRISAAGLSNQTNNTLRANSNSQSIPRATINAQAGNNSSRGGSFLSSQNNSDRANSRTTAVKLDVSNMSDSDLMASLPQTAGALRDTVVKNPRMIFRLIQFAPHRVNGQTVGFQIKGGLATNIMAQFGLAVNDVVTRVNGMDLSSQRRAMNAMRQMVSARQVNLIVLRGGTEIPLVVDLSS